MTTVKQASFDLEGNVVVIDTYRIEGATETQAPLAIGDGERPIETAGPLLAPPKKRRKATPICDECLTAAYDEGASADIARAVCRTMGADIADHCCEAVETGRPCGCACRGS